MTEALVLSLIFAGALVQRVAGLGFAMVASPFLVLIIGPDQGVLVINALGAASALLVVTRVWRNIDWRIFTWLAIPAFLAVLPAVQYAAANESPVLFVTIGVISIAAITFSLGVRRLDVRFSGRAAMVIAGGSAGLSNAIAGMGGPPLTAYAILRDWPHRSFVATIQPLFLVMGIASLSAKLFLFPVTVPPWPWWMWTAIFACLVLGVLLGDRADQRFKPSTLRTWILVIALTGAAMVLIRGLVMLSTA
ncbi:hypothetical protein SUDANB171_03257 [Streptomyces sp. enrichment culture]|jgi:uncharacterized membrane protein YfcA|uniref:TSUP family transporter n=1 Tax=Streptomyces xiamenensis TaxID=408015 RepID=UPI0036EF4129